MANNTRDCSELTIHQALTVKEQEAVFKFRYGVYVEEMGKQLGCSDHDHKTLRDELDDCGHIFYVGDEERIVATVRLNLLTEGVLPDFLRKNLAWDHLGDLKRTSSYTSRLMVAPEWRNTLILGRLLNHLFHYGKKRGLNTDFCYCAPCLVNTYEHLGYRRYKDNFIDPDVGYRVPLVLFTDDADYLKSIRSPFYRLTRRYAPTGFDPSNFFNVFAYDPYYIVNQFQTGEQFWSHLSRNLHDESIQFFRDFNQEEIDTFLKNSSIIECREGDHIVRTGDMGNEMFLIIDGVAEVCRFVDGKRYTMTTLGRGQIFGEIAFLSSTPRSADVLAMTDMQVLVLTQQFFRRITKLMPALSARATLNLAVVLCERLKNTSTHWLDAVCVLDDEEDRDE